MATIAKKQIYIFCVLLLLAIHALLSALAIFAKSPTFDESVHLAGGYTFWKFDDFRINPENGILPQRWASLPLLFRSDINFPENLIYWKKAQEWFFSFFFIFKSGNDPDSLFISAKFMMLLLSLSLCLSVFYISYQIFGKYAALLSLFFSSFSPSILAHSNLVASDLCAALFFLLSSYFTWLNFRKINFVNTLLTSISLALLFLSKMSAPIIIPFYLLCILAALRSEQPPVCEFRKTRISLNTEREKIKAFITLIVIHSLAVYFAVWAAYSFRFSQVPIGSDSYATVELQFNELLKGERDTIDNIFLSIDKFRLLPRAYTHGYLHVKKHLKKRISFMNGEKSNSGFSLFFPYAFGLKTPIPLLLIFILSLFLAWKKRQALKGFFPLAIFAALFAIFALASKINIGHRHLLPLYPVIFIFCGLPFKEKISAKLKIFILLSTAWFAIETLNISPHYLAYFNQLAGGPQNGYKKLVDSSLDWGQDLKELKKICEQKFPEEKKFYISYFGTSSINSYGLQNFISLPGYFTQENMQFCRYKTGVYCVSATMLYLLYYQDIFATLKFPPDILFDDSFEKLEPFINEFLDEAEKGDKNLYAFLSQYGEEFCLRRYKAYDLIRFAKLCEYLKNRKPDSYAGYSILIFRLSEEEIKKAMKSKVSF